MDLTKLYLDRAKMFLEIMNVLYKDENLKCLDISRMIKELQESIFQLHICLNVSSENSGYVLNSGDIYKNTIEWFTKSIDEVGYKGNKEALAKSLYSNIFQEKESRS